jgi:hypothetical protein
MVNFSVGLAISTLLSIVANEQDQPNGDGEIYPYIGISPDLLPVVVGAAAMLALRVG